jgi:hypothetical protein
MVQSVEACKTRPGDKVASIETSRRLPTLGEFPAEGVGGVLGGESGGVRGAGGLGGSERGGNVTPTPRNAASSNP